MTPLQNASLQFKQTAIIMATPTAALLLACIALVVFEVISFRKVMMRDLSIMADVIGNNCAASLDFNDAKSAEETLSALKSQSNIAGAFLFSQDGKVFAGYHRPNDGRTLVPPPFQLTGHYFS